jgi:hypothetical protein
MRVAGYNALCALNFTCSNRVVIQERCRFCINLQSAKCVGCPVLMPGFNAGGWVQCAARANPHLCESCSQPRAMPLSYKSAVNPMPQICRPYAGVDNIPRVFDVAIQTECAYLLSRYTVESLCDAVV